MDRHDLSDIYSPADFSYDSVSYRHKSTEHISEQTFPGDITRTRDSNVTHRNAMNLSPAVPENHGTKAELRLPPLSLVPFGKGGSSLYHSSVGIPSRAASTRESVGMLKDDGAVSVRSSDRKHASEKAGTTVTAQYTLEGLKRTGFCSIKEFDVVGEPFTQKKVLGPPVAAKSPGYITSLELSKSSPSSASSFPSFNGNRTRKALDESFASFTALQPSGSQETLVDKEDNLPPVKGSSILIWLRYYIFNVYRRLFSVVFVGNIATMVTIFAYRRTLNDLKLSDLSTATAANVTVCLLMRQENVINFLFTAACAVPRWTPLFIRRNSAKIFHIGGIHSSAGVAAVFWFLILTVTATMGLIAPKGTSLGKPNLAIALILYIILVLFIAILSTSYPSFRVKHHDIFERTHRFGGWTILVLFWILTVLSADASRGRVPLSRAITKDPTLYLLIVSTISVILPWLYLHKVSVRPEFLSQHAIRLHFKYTNSIPGTTIRISEKPLVEWHAFATIAKPDIDGFSLVVSNAGDWTKRQIGRAPKKIWVRGVPTCGVLRVVPLFRRVVLVATGSGIGPLLPVMMAAKAPMRIFWSTKNPEQTFGKEIINTVKDADSNAVIWNTRKQGKPDMIKEIWKLVVESGMTREGKFEVEAVFIIANKKATDEVVHGMEARGLAAYGALFDS